MQPQAAASAPAEAQEHVQQQVAEWLRLDTDAASRDQVQGMLDKQAFPELRELMCQRLEFGEEVEGKVTPRGYNSLIYGHASWQLAAECAANIVYRAATPR